MSMYGQNVRLAPGDAAFRNQYVPGPVGQMLNSYDDRFVAPSAGSVYPATYEGGTVFQNGPTASGSPQTVFEFQQAGLLPKSEHLPGISPIDPTIYLPGQYSAKRIPARY